MQELTNLSIVKSAVKNGADWMSKKELADMCRVDKKTIQRTVNDILKLDPRIQIQSHIKNGGYHNNEVFYDGYLVKLIQAKLLSNQANRGNSSDTIKSVVKTAVKNELTKTLSKDELKLELEKLKTEKQRLRTEQTKSITEREIALSNNKIIIIREKKEFARQQSIKKALKIKNFTEPLKQELKIMSKELAQAAVQAEYTKKLKQLDADGKYMLYIFYNPTNPTIYKIGKSNSLGNRLAIGTSENPNLQILYKKWCNCQLSCDELEETIHQELREYNYNNYSDTGSKEWFVLTKEKLNEIVNKYEFIQSSY